MMGYSGKKLGFPSNNLNFHNADNYLGAKSSKTIGNNTYLEREFDGSVAVRHWSTNIITYRPDGSIIIDLNGYFTATTKARLSRYLDAVKVWSNRGEQIITHDGIDYEFEDGLVIHPDGTIKAQPLLAKMLGKRLGKDIPTLEILKDILAALTIPECKKVWGIYKNDRKLLAQYLPLEFLPLVVGTENKSVYSGMYWKDERWSNIIAQRLKATKEE